MIKYFINKYRSIFSENQISEMTISLMKNEHVKLKVNPELRNLILNDIVALSKSGIDVHKAIGIISQKQKLVGLQESTNIWVHIIR